MVIIRNIANGSFLGTPFANGAQGQMKFMAGERWLATHRAASASAFLVLPLQPKHSSRSRDANSFATIASLSQKRNTSRKENMRDAEPTLCDRQEAA